MSEQKRPSRSGNLEDLHVELQKLEEENTGLRKTVAALMDRVEESMARHGDAFTLFQTAARLEEAVRVRTEELEAVNQRLTTELRTRREIQEALKQAKKNADEANLLKTKFLAAASHDLRQPLNSALLFMQAIEEDEIPENNRFLLGKTKLALGSLSNLLGTLLDVTKLEGGGIEPQVEDFRLSEMLDPVVEEYRELAHFADLELHYVSSRVVIRTDRHLLETVVRNFISNAIRYTRQGRILVGCRRRPGEVEVCVSDTGIGIDPSKLKDIFQAYYQIEHDHQDRNTGMGLGLSIVDRIVDLLQLRRFVRSEPGRGSVFGVCVPSGNPQQLRRDGLHVQPGSLLSKTLVVIDDDEDVLRGMKAIVDTWGCNALFASDATAALVELINRDLEPDLILSDYHLGPGSNGIEAITEVAREFDSPVAGYLMTSETDPVLLQEIRKSGMEILPKPVNLRKLRNLLATDPALLPERR